MCARQAWRRPRWRAALLVAVTALLSTAMVIAGETQPSIYRFGVVPQYDARHLATVWEPILAELERRSGVRFELMGSARTPEFEAEFAAGRFDFAYMNPYHVLRAAGTQGYIPLVRDRTPLHGVLVIRRDSPIKVVPSLRDQEIAFPSPNAMGASLLLRAELERQFDLRFTPRYVQTHSSVYLNVATGRLAAGGGVLRTLEEQPGAVRDRLRVLYTTRPVPSHPIVVHPRVPTAVRTRVSQALLEMGAGPAGRTLLAGIPMTEVVAASLADYRPVAAMHLEKYAVAE